MKKIFSSKLLWTITLALVIVAAIVVGVLVFDNGGYSRGELIDIYTSNYVLKDFTKKIGGNKVEVTSLVRPGEESHGFEPSALQMAKMNEGDLIVINGLGFEAWSEKLDSNLSAKVVDTSINTNLLTLTGEEHIHDEDGHTHGNGDYDPHIWLSFDNAIKQMENIKNALIAIDISNSQYYTNNFAKYSLLFTSLKNEYIVTLSNPDRHSIVVSHRAFAYLCHDYDLLQLSLSGIESDSEPDAATLANITDYINTNDVKVVFYQSAINSKVADMIAKNTNAKTLLLHTIENLTNEEIEEGADYLSLMSQNLINLKVALLDE